MPVSTLWPKAAVSIAAIVLLAAAGCSSGFSVAKPASKPPLNSSPALTPGNGATQSNAEGAVTIDIEWAGVQGDSLVFKVAMDTHSVGLDGYDLSKLAILKDGDGTDYIPAGWNSAAGGHHRSGILSFPIPPSLGTAPNAEIVVRDIAGVKERIFQWQLR